MYKYSNKYKYGIHKRKQLKLLVDKISQNALKNLIIVIIPISYNDNEGFMRSKYR